MTHLFKDSPYPKDKIENLKNGFQGLYNLILTSPASSLIFLHSVIEAPLYSSAFLSFSDMVNC